MNRHRKSALRQRRCNRKRRFARPYLIDIEDFETVEEIEMDDWMFGSSGGNQV
jgi:cytidylate kinase